MTVRTCQGVRVGRQDGELGEGWGGRQHDGWTGKIRH